MRKLGTAFLQNLFEKGRIVWLKKKRVFLNELVSGLTKTRDNIVSGFDSIFSGFSHIDDDFTRNWKKFL